MEFVLKISNPYQVSFNDISKLEKMCKIKFNSFEKILLVNNGTTELILRVLFNTSTKINIISQKESKNILRRKSQIVTRQSKPTVLIEARSKVYLNRIPSKIIDELRLGQDGIGMILLKHRIETFKKITKIGYLLEKNSISRRYIIFYKDQDICEITEKFMEVRKSILRIRTV